MLELHHVKSLNKQVNQLTILVAHASLFVKDFQDEITFFVRTKLLLDKDNFEKL